MVTAETPVGLDKLRVLIWPYQRQYAAECLELSTIIVKSTKEEAATGTTQLIDGLIFSCLRDEYPIATALHASLPSVQEAYTRAESFPHTPTLSPKVQAVVREIEYRFYPETIPD